MANWSEPTNASAYATVLELLRQLATDAATLFANTPSNQPVNSIRYNRSTNIFEQWNGTSWIPLTLALAGGGTGATTPAAGRTALELGTIATQNHNSVNITGGNISGFNIPGNVTQTGSFSMTPTLAGQNALGVTGKSGNHGIAVVSAGTSGQNFGIFLQAGTTSADNAMLVRDNAAVPMLTCRGDRAILVHRALVIPVGADMWAEV